MNLLNIHCSSNVSHITRYHSPPPPPPRPLNRHKHTKYTERVEGEQVTDQTAKYTLTNWPAGRRKRTTKEENKRHLHPNLLRKINHTFTGRLCRVEMERSTPGRLSTPLQEGSVVLKWRGLHQGRVSRRVR